MGAQNEHMQESQQKLMAEFAFALHWTQH